LTKNRISYFYKNIFLFANSKKPSSPYWLKETMSEGHFNVSDPLKIGQAKPG
jgi:hypothetical protein